MTQAVAQPATASMADKLRSVQVGLREDLEATRHLFRGEPAYIVRDPVTFQSQRLAPADYNVFVSIHADRPLSDTFNELVEAGSATRADEEKFYQFIMMLHRIGFLHLPVSDDKALYRRYQMKERARRKEKMMGFLSLRVPLWNPNAFLDRTIGRVRPMFRVPFFMAWVALMLTAGTILALRWEEVSQPVQGLLVAQNLPLMWITLIGLKVFHEFGHAYACKHYGGHVPEMGAYFIMLTPCAYMDATSSWGFTRKRHRLYVCLAGMYFESMLAAVAVFVWALTDPSLLHSAAYNVIFLATVVTILFNINPLMRFDGYFVLSDLTEIPNLRAKSTQYVFSVFKRVLFGIRSPNAPASRRLRFVLLTYGVAASIYKVALLLAISAMLAAKLFWLGMGLAIFYFGSAAITGVVKLTRYLWWAEETANTRRRAIALSVVTLAVLPVALFVVPIPSHTTAKGVFVAENETVARAREPGFIQTIHVECPQTVGKGDRLVEIGNDQLLEGLATAQADLQASRIRIDAYRVHEPHLVQQEEAMVEVYRKSVERAQARLAELKVDAPREGRVIESIKATDVGSFVSAGSPIATIVSGCWQIRSILTEDQVVSTNPTVGDRIEIKALGMPSKMLVGVIRKIAPAGSKTIEHASLTHALGGDIAVNPKDGTAAEPYFEITVDLPGSDVLETGSHRPDAAAVDLPELRYGMTGSIRLPTAAEPIGTRVVRRFIRFVNKLLQE